jgi:uncharacterized ubiquitin-like protein YukD
LFLSLGGVVPLGIIILGFIVLSLRRKAIMTSLDLTELIKIIPSAIIGAAVAYVAYQQWKTNERRLKSELYDRRFAVYETLMDTIGEVMQKEDISVEQLEKFNIQRRKSHFLFSKKVSDFLEEIYDKLVDLQTMNQVSPDEKATNAKERGNIKKWFLHQISVAREKFKDDLN